MGGENIVLPEDVFISLVEREANIEWGGSYIDICNDLKVEFEKPQIKKEVEALKKETESFFDLIYNAPELPNIRKNLLRMILVSLFQIISLRSAPSGRLETLDSICKDVAKRAAEKEVERHETIHIYIAVIALVLPECREKTWF